VSFLSPRVGAIGGQTGDGREGHWVGWWEENLQTHHMLPVGESKDRPKVWERKRVACCISKSDLAREY
jgi:hypothetical protein